MANAWTGTARFIQGDIADCFGSLDHDMMIKGLSENIHDNRFLRLARNMPTAGYLEEGSWDPTRSGGSPGRSGVPDLPAQAGPARRKQF
jgi:retron-type reverse transcriptase